MDSVAVRRLRSSTEEALDRVRGHRFVRDAHRGNLSREQVLRWISCAGRESRTFPRILENMLERVDDLVIQQVLKENLADEYGNGDPNEAHFQHYMHLLAQVGLTEQDFLSYEEKAGIRLALELAHTVSTQPNVPVAIGYMLVNEGMTPITYGAVEVAVKPHFPDLRTPFFALHVEVDERHVAELYHAVGALDDDTLDDVLFGVALGERGMAVLLDEALGVFDELS